MKTIADLRVRRADADYRLAPPFPKHVYKELTEVTEYRNHGIRFLYPEDWDVDEGRTDESLTITASSSETSFWCVSVFADKPACESVLSAAVAAFQEEYDEVDVYPMRDEELRLLGEEPNGQDVQFVCLELVNTVCLRAVEMDDYTVLVLFQGTDHELESTRNLLEGITASLQIAAE